MVYRNNVYITVDKDNDNVYYRLMTIWKQIDNSDFKFFDSHDIYTVKDSNKELLIKIQLVESIMDTNVFVVLIGDNTRYSSKLVKCEIEAALYVGLPIIGVNLNKNKRMDNLCPPVLRNALAVFIPYEKRIIQYALENWSESHYQRSRKGKTSHIFTEIVCIINYQRNNI